MRSSGMNRDTVENTGKGHKKINMVWACHNNGSPARAHNRHTQSQGRLRHIWKTCNLAEQDMDTWWKRKERCKGKRNSIRICVFSVCKKCRVGREQIFVKIMVGASLKFESGILSSHKQMMKTRLPISWERDYLCMQQNFIISNLKGSALTAWYIRDSK